MIHEVLRLTRPLIVFDLETTSVDVEAARIVEIGFQIWTEQGMIREWRSLVDPGVPIPAESTEAHKIDDDRLKRCNDCGCSSGPTLDGSFCRCKRFKPVPQFKQIAPSLARGFRDCDYAGKNVRRYDLPVLAREFERAGVAWSYRGARIVDVERLEQLGDPRTLGDLYKKHVGEDPVVAHEALADVRMTAAVIAAQVRKHRLPLSVDALQDLQWPGSGDWVDAEGKFVFIDGIPCFGKWGEHAGKAMAAVDARNWIWDFILRKGFSPEVKALARDRKLGKFPTREAL